MGIWQGLAAGFQISCGPLNLSLIVLGSLVGLFIGILPGIRCIHGVSILMPVSYTVGMPVETTLIFLVSIYCGTVCGNRIADLQHDPWARTCKDTGPLSALSAVSVFTGGILAVFGAVLCVAGLRRLAVRFDPSEYFALVVFALACLAVRAGSHPLRTLASTCIGLMMATIGIDSTTGVLRFAMGQATLYDGIEFTTVVIGLFAVSRVFFLFEQQIVHRAAVVRMGKVVPDMEQLWSYRSLVLRSSFVGFLVGLLPGAGISIAGDFNRDIQQGLSLDPPDSGTRKARTVAAQESANSAAIAGAMVPMLALGIPGSGTTAVMLGSLLQHNITPGPMLFIQHAGIIWAILASMCVGSLILLFINLFLARYMVWVNRIPNWIIVPCLIVSAFIGGYSVNGSSFSILLLILLGGFGYLLERFEYPLIPLLVGFVLGDLMEDNLRRALAISGGQINTLFESRISIVLFAMAFLVVVLPLVWKRLKKKAVS